MSTAPALDPAHTALLVMDYQPAALAFLPEGGDREALLARVEGAIAYVRANGGTIAYVRVGFTEADWYAIPATNKSKVDSRASLAGGPSVSASAIARLRVTIGLGAIRSRIR
ncbi:hypothetical protein QMK19_33345 [Streptomyces sp. H10-C2]|uniref:hypothetical protein n=1 Tax=unclassified Streptomyces TaxID=2593676 RepID=UPI0024BA2AD5|nr:MULTISPECIES: hypothetical protein [unclassified Streptomyces]MDJ0346447.1 hypothetical protein [Streptomyces sp. PH10-H1]MDJ0374386.1 hypothetical protein [Streptomyces sp. H10-C2]